MTTSKIRYQVLDDSLILENQLSKIISELIRVPKTETKTLGHQSSSLTFKTKVDLLYDLDRISKEEYNLFILFIEIRNQLVHNFHSDSLKKVFDNIESNKKSKLLKINPNVEEHYNKSKKRGYLNNDSEEKNLEFGYSYLFLKLKEIILEQHSKLIEDFKKEKTQEMELNYHQKMNEIYLAGNQILNETIEEFGEIFSKEIEKKIDSKIEFKKLLIAFVNKKSIEKLKEKFPDFDPDRNK